MTFYLWIELVPITHSYHQDSRGKEIHSNGENLNNIVPTLHKLFSEDQYDLTPRNHKTWIIQK